MVYHELKTVEIFNGLEWQEQRSRAVVVADQKIVIIQVQSCLFRFLVWEVGD